MKEDTSKKKCSCCKEIKSRTEFYKRRDSKDGLRNVCKLCMIDITKSWHEKKRIESPFYRWAKNTLKGHKHRGYQVNITSEELEDIVSKTKTCQICGCELKRGNGKVTDISPTLDRKNNENVIDINNIMILCNYCNLTKGKRPIIEFIKFCELVVARKSTIINGEKNDI